MFEGVKTKNTNLVGRMKASYSRYWSSMPLIVRFGLGLSSASSSEDDEELLATSSLSGISRCGEFVI